MSVYRTGKNLLNTATNITGKYISSSGSINNGDDAQYTDLIPVKAGEIYVCSLVSGRNSGTNRWHGYDANGTWVKQLASVSATDQQGAKLVMTVMIDSGISYVRLSYGITDTEAMIQLVPLSGEIIADGFYEGKYVSNTTFAYRDVPIESPYTSSYVNRGPAMVFSITPGKMYGIKDDIVTNYTSIAYSCYADIEDITGSVNAISRGNGKLFVAPNGANYAVVLYNTSNSGTTFTFGEPSALEFQSQADYQPYAYDEYPCDWTSEAGTVYVGALDVVTGQLTVDWAYKEFDGTEQWFIGSNYMVCFDAVDYGSKSNNDATQISNVFIGAGNYYANYNSFRVQTNKAVLVGNKNEDGTVGRWADATAFKTFLTGLYSAGTPFAVCYELATPVTYQLTPQEVESLLGVNNIWSDSGDVTVVLKNAETYEEVTE